jgi:hypothetical protein
MPTEDGWTQPGPGLLRVRFKCGHVKYLPKPTVYRDGYLHTRRCRECCLAAEAEAVAKRAEKAARKEATR